jgi:hypothetical protein
MRRKILLDKKSLKIFLKYINFLNYEFIRYYLIPNNIYYFMERNINVKSLVILGLFIIYSFQTNHIFNCFRTLNYDLWQRNSFIFHILSQYYQFKRYHYI